MGASQRINRNPAPSPEVNAQLEQQKQLSAQLAEQQKANAAGYIGQLDSIKSTYDSQYGILSQQAAEQRAQSQAQAEALRQQLAAAETARVEQQKLLDEQLAAEQQKTAIAVDVSNRSAIGANEQSVRNSSSVNQLLNAQSARSSYRNSVLRNAGTPSLGNNTRASPSLLRR